jgi:hypothetical protein
MKRGPRAIITAGLTALAIVGSTLASTTPASAYWRHGHWYGWHHHYYGWHHRYYRHYAYRHYYYGPGPIFGGLGLLAGAAAALTVGPYPYYYGPYYGPYW